MDAIGSTWTGGPRVSELGEFGLIARIRERAPLRPGALLLGPGDDAALLALPAGWDLVLTCDMQLEGRHFRRAWMTPRELGARAIEVNLSDLAAMGALPVAALVSLGLPQDLPVPVVDALYEGMTASLAPHEAALAGGNITASDRLIVDVTLAGRVESGRALRRAGARVGEIVFVTGCPGRAAAALAGLAAAPETWDRLAAGVKGAADALRERFRLFHAAPAARLAAARFLVENQTARAAIDQSDGLGGDLAHVAEESRVRIVLEEAHLPLDPEVEALAALLGVDPLDWTLGPSDDYELVFTTPRAQAGVAFAMGASLGLAVTPIGEVVAGEPGVALRRRDGSIAAIGAGWDHLRAR
jgi:thiamine-monophosphate kinase